MKAMKVLLLAVSLALVGALPSLSDPWLEAIESNRRGLQRAFPPSPSPPGSGGSTGGSGCAESCVYASDGDCDDGGPGTEYTSCSVGSDCTDCGPRSSGPPLPPSRPAPPSPPPGRGGGAPPPPLPSPPPGGAAPPSPSPPGGGGSSVGGGCAETCTYASDGDCDDGGPGAEFNSCSVGSDCTDCGNRAGGSGPPSPAAISPPSPSPPVNMPPPPSPSVSCACGSDATSYSTYGSAVNCFGANDVTNLEVMFGGLAIDAGPREFYTMCSDYDNDGVFRANDLTNMKRYYAGLLSPAAWVLAGRRLSISTSPTVKALPSSSATTIKVEPWTSSGGAQFLKIDINTPKNKPFTTLRLVLETDAVIDESLMQAYSFIASDTLYPMQAGTGTFKASAADWMDYSVTLNKKPAAGLPGFVLVLSTASRRASPAELYIKLSSPASYVKTSSTAPIELADGQTPSQLMTTPSLTSSLTPIGQPCNSSIICQLRHYWVQLRA